MESNYAIQIFEAAGYVCVGIHPKKNILSFYHSSYAMFFEFPFTEKTSLVDVIATITSNAFDIGFKKAETKTRLQMKSAIGLM